MPDEQARFEFSARPNEPVIEICRWFPAPPIMVFEAWTAPEHLCHWWGPASLPVTECNVDMRPGGSYRYVLRSRDGQPFGVSGRFVEVDPPSRLVTNFRLDAVPEDEVVEVTSFDHSAGGTAVRVVSLHRSCAARDAHLADGALQTNVAEELSRLDEVLTPRAPV